MALLQIYFADTTAAAANTTALQAALALATEGVRIINTGAPVQFRAISGGVAPMPANRTLAGLEVTAGQDPVTSVAIASSDGSGANFVYVASSGIATGIVVRDLKIDGGRSLGGWGSQTGACVTIAGQNDYSGTLHGVQLLNLHLFDGLTQQWQINSVNGWTLYRVKTWATTGPTVAAHGGDVDAVANDKPSKNGWISYGDLDADGQECLKFENATDIVVEDSTIRMYVTLTQDNADCYSELGRITFRRCLIDASINLGFLKRRHVPSQPANVRKASDTLTVSGAGTVGGTVTATSSPTAFAGGDVGKSVGAYSGFGTGFGVIESVTTGTATIRVHDTFANNDGTPLVFEANEWVLGYCDTGGDGSVTFDRNTFTSSGLVWPQDGNSGNYGTQTITDNAFDPAGNSYLYPVGVTPTASGNLFDGLPVKRFARPSLNAKYASLGGTGITSYSEGMARGNATDNINTAIGYASNGQEVWCLDGMYTAAAGGANRSISLGGKTILVRAETPHRVWVNLTGGSGWNGLASSADVAGSRIWGIVFYGAGQGGGNGANINISGNSAITVSRCAALGGRTANNGANFRITSTGAWVVEDYLSDDADGGATVGGLYVSAVPTGTPGTLRRGVVRNSRTTGSGVAASVRLDSAGVLVEGLEVSGGRGNAAGAIAGILATKNATIKGLTCADNASGAGAVCNDLSVANTFTVTGDSWICRSTAGGLKPLNATSTTGAIVLDRSNLAGWDGTNGSVINGSPGTCTLTNISAASPLFADATGGNYQLQAGSPCRNTGVARAGGNDISWDTYQMPFTQPDQGAWAYT